MNARANRGSVRDTGNDNAVLESYRKQVEEGRLLGPNIFRAGVIEGVGPDASDWDFMVSTLAEAEAAIDWYAQRGKLHRTGVPLVAGTDFVAGLSLHKELRLMSEAGIPPAEVLRIATWNGAP